MSAVAVEKSASAKVRTPSPPQYYKPAPAEIGFGNLRFLITDRPTDHTIQQFVEELKKHSANIVIRVCEPTYQTDVLAKENISVHDLEFEDGSFPSDNVLKEFLRLVCDHFRADPASCIAIHCVAGLGRAPVLVAVALMEAGMKFEDTVELIRKHRRGAINQKQLNGLQKYKSSGLLKGIKNGKKDKDCSLM